MTAISANKPVAQDANLPFKVRQRLNELEGKVNAFAKKMIAMNTKAPHITTQLLSEMSLGACASPSSKYIKINSLLLLKASDLPTKLQLKGMNDPRLQSNAYLEEVSNWISSYFNLPKKPLNSIDKHYIRVFLQFISDPKLSDYARDFVLGHEVAHIIHQHRGELFPFLDFLANVTNLFLYGVYLTTSSAAVAAACSQVIPMVAAAYIVATLYESSISKTMEKEADLTSVRHVKNAKEGGVYYFDTCANDNKKALENGLASWFQCYSNGDKRFNWTHPALSERINYIKKAY